jgi:hypothetical protein
MDAGLALDALVAEKVMGAVACGNWKPFHAGEMSNDMSCGHVSCFPPGCVPPYSTIIGWAWMVVEKFRRGIPGHVSSVVEMTVSDEAIGPDCTCKIYGCDLQEVETTQQEMPLAICIAALMAVGE